MIVNFAASETPMLPSVVRDNGTPCPQSSDVTTVREVFPEMVKPLIQLPCFWPNLSDSVLVEHAPDGVMVVEKAQDLFDRGRNFFAQGNLQDTLYCMSLVVDAAGVYVPARVTLASALDAWGQKHDSIEMLKDTLVFLSQIENKDNAQWNNYLTRPVALTEIKYYLAIVNLNLANRASDSKTAVSLLQSSLTFLEGPDMVKLLGLERVTEMRQHRYASMVAILATSNQSTAACLAYAQGRKIAPKSWEHIFNEFVLEYPELQKIKFA